ncbi:MAG: protein TolR [Desulfuromonas sp.]|nr:MAG: protein TolR [Desulfuromonas sp.]
MEVGSRDTGSRRTLSQINVTPFVDVMLVLLIIFMVTAPMMEQGFDVNLPEVENAPGIASKEEPVVVTVDRRGRISIGQSRVNTTAKLIPLLKQVMKERKDKSVLLEADQAVAYVEVMQVMAAVKSAGISRVGMVTQQPKR